MNLKSQIVISSWGGLRRARPYAFTEGSDGFDIADCDGKGKAWRPVNKPDRDRNVAPTIGEMRNMSRPIALNIYQGKA